MKKMFVNAVGDVKSPRRVRTVGAAAVLLLAVCAAIVSCSALPEEDASEVKNPSVKKETPFTPRALMSDGTHVKLVFPREVSKVEELKITPEVAVVNPEAEVTGSAKEKWSVEYELSDTLEIGKEYTISGKVSNKTGRTEAFSAAFIGANDAEPELEITEVHPMYDAKSKKGEYVKLKVVTGGNLSGIKIYSAHDRTTVYDFPAVEVEDGELIVVHLRTNAAGAVNELGDDLDLSSAPCSVSGARDLWPVNKKSARLGDEEDVILVKNASGSRILDAILYSQPDASDWSEGRSKKMLQKSAGDAVTAGKWQPDASAGNAASSDKMASLKVLAKTGAGNEKASWTVQDMD